MPELCHQAGRRQANVIHLQQIPTYFQPPAAAVANHAGGKDSVCCCGRQDRVIADLDRRDVE
jgi:hypothetical protein